MTRAKIILVSVILAAGVFGIFYSLGADEATADTVASDSQWSPSDAGERTAEATVAAEYPAWEDSGDWIDTEWYVGEVTDTIGKMTGLADTMAEAGYAVADGLITEAEFAMLADEAVTSVSGHIDYFEGVEPPQAFDEANDHFMDALYDMRTGMEYARDGATYGDYELIDTAAIYIRDAADSLGRVALNFPTDY